MAVNRETLSHDGLVYILMMEIAKQEGKFAVDGWKADRDYVLDLAAEVIKAVTGKREKPMDINPTSTAALRARTRS